MYLARVLVDNQPRYLLRESLRQGELWVSRDLTDLGPDPARFIHYLGGTSYELDGDLLDRLQTMGVSQGWEKLDDILHPFMDPQLRFRLEPFRERTRNRRWAPMDRHARERAIEETHDFDRRRLFFLRFGQYDARRLNRCQPVYRILLDKSRDEIEQSIQQAESQLKAREVRSYLFAAFDLQRRLDAMHSGPGGYRLDELDEAFTATVCDIDQDPSFWSGFDRQSSLPPYLRRYVILWFDHILHHRDPSRQFFANFGSGRGRPAAAPVRGMAMQEALAILGLDQETYAGMNRRQLRQIYRALAKKHHPDHGGEHERFIALNRAYAMLARHRA